MTNAGTAILREAGIDDLTATMVGGWHVVIGFVVDRALTDDERSRVDRLLADRFGVDLAA